MYTVQPCKQESQTFIFNLAFLAYKIKIRGLNLIPNLFDTNSVWD